jgi:fibronectin type 3 domain-containing protein
MPGFSIPAFDMETKKVDRMLPTVQFVKTNADPSSVILEWKPVHSRKIAGYRIFRSDKSAKGGFRLVKTLTDPYASHYTDTGLNPATSYTYMVSVFTKDGRVSMPVRSNPTLTQNRIKAVPYFKAMSNLPDRIKLIWKVHPNSEVDRYIIQRKELKSRIWRTIKTINNRRVVEYIDQGVQPGVLYNYRIVAKTYDGVFAYPSNIERAVARPLPQIVLQTRATTNLPKRVELIWKKSAEARVDYYKIYASSFADGVYSFIAKTRATNYIDRFDKDGATRYYKITAVDKDGLESPKPKLPTVGRTLGYLRAPILNKYVMKNNVAYLSWTPQDRRTKSYTIVKKYWDKFRVKKLKIVGFKQTTFVDKKVAPNIKYSYYVLAVDENGIESEPSQEVELIVNMARTW